MIKEDGLQTAAEERQRQSKEFRTAIVFYDDCDVAE